MQKAVQQITWCKKATKYQAQGTERKTQTY